MNTILVVDDMAIIRDPIAASLRLAGFRTLCAASGAEGLKLAKNKRPDLILLDVAMPEMDGIAFLRHLRADPHIADTRVMLLTAVSDKKLVIEAVALGVGDYLLKSRFRLQDLLERIQKQLGGAPVRKPRSAAARRVAEATPLESTRDAATSPESVVPTSASTTIESSNIPKPLTRDECVQRTEGIFQAKTLSGVVMEVIALASSPRGDATQLASLIGRDPLLSARVLQAANSAAYASSSGIVSTIPNAIRKIGSAAVRNVAAALGVFDVMPTTSVDGFNPIHCWQHSFAVAKLCEQLAEAKVPELAGVAYVTGLCHDLAEIFIHTQFAAEYQHVIEMTERTGRPREQLEREIMGMTRVELVKTIFRCIGLPDTIREPVEILHGPGADRTTNALASILWMAENYANGIMLASGPTSLISPIPQAMCVASTGLTDPPLPDAVALRSEVMCLTAMLARLSASEEAKLMRPMFPPRAANIWLARDPGLSSFDPIETALSSLAEVQVHPRLPTGSAADNLHGVVIISRSDTKGIAAEEIEQLAADRARVGRSLPMLWVCCTVTGQVQPGKGPVPVAAPLAIALLANFVNSAAATAAGPLVDAVAAT
jgi:CheY-like chemotaxis protein/HD-like signal output (HDOD) protein